MAARTFGFEFIEVGLAAEDRAIETGAVELDPFRRSGQRIEAALEVDFPGTGEKIEIVLAVAFGRADRSGADRQTHG